MREAKAILDIGQAASVRAEGRIAFLQLGGVGQVLKAIIGTVQIGEEDVTAAIALRDEGNAPAVGVPRRRKIVGGMIGEAYRLLIERYGKDPDIEIAGLVGLIGNPAAIRRPGRVALIARCFRKGAHLPALKVQQVEIPVSAPVGGESDAFTKRVDGRITVIPLAEGDLAHRPPRAGGTR